MTTRSRVPLAREARRSIEQRLRRALQPFGPRIERATIRFEDVNGPRHGVDLRCSVKVVFSGTDSIVVEQQGTSVLESVRRIMPRVGRVVRRHVDQIGGKTPRASHPSRARARQSRSAKIDASDRELPGNLMGRRAGRNADNWRAVLARPEKLRGDAVVDTAEVGVSASDRRAGGESSARRNSKSSDSGMVSALEDARGQPSRKSTRGSARRMKAATQLTRRTQRRVRSPSARAARGS